MPRTKRRTVKRSSSDLNMTAANATVANQPKSIREILDEFDQEKVNIENHYNQLADYYTNLIETSFLMVKMNLADSMHKNLYEYIAERNLKESNAPTTTQRAERPSRTLTKTAGKTTRPKSVTTATSTTNTVTKKRKITKSEDRALVTEENESSKYKTPINRPPSSAAVTPKVNMNEPMSVLRRPNQGEIALSMTGSPLMVSSVARDDMATISVPLPNGNIMSILPRHGANTFNLDMSFDEQTKKQLYVLKGNIENILKINQN